MEGETARSDHGLVFCVEFSRPLNQPKPNGLGRSKRNVCGGGDRGGR